MEKEKLYQLVNFLSLAKNCKVSFNVPAEDNYDNVHEVIIHECSAACINDLIGMNYSLFMTEKGLVVDHYK